MINDALLQQLWQQYATLRDAPPVDARRPIEDAGNINIASIGVPLTDVPLTDDVTPVASTGLPLTDDVPLPDDVPPIASTGLPLTDFLPIASTGLPLPDDVPPIASMGLPLRDDVPPIAATGLPLTDVPFTDDPPIASMGVPLTGDVPPIASIGVPDDVPHTDVLPIASPRVPDDVPLTADVQPIASMELLPAQVQKPADAETTEPARKQLRMPMGAISKKKKYVTTTDIEAHDKTGCLFMTSERQVVGYRFGCNSFASSAALATTSVLLTKGLLAGDQISIRSSLRIKQNLNGATGYSAVIRGPIYHLQAGVSFADGKKMVLLHAAKVLFRVYVKLVSKLRVLFFETSLENYIGQTYDDCDEKTQDVILRKVAIIPTLSPLANIISPANILHHATRVLEKMTKSLTEGSHRESCGYNEAENEQDFATNFIQDDNVDASPQASLVGSEEASLVGSEEASLVGSEEASLVGSEEASLVGSEEASLVGSEEASLVGSEEASLVGSEEASLVGSEEASLLCSEEVSFGGSEEDEEERAPKKKQVRATKRKRNNDENNACFFCSKSKANVLFPCGLHAACGKCMRNSFGAGGSVPGRSVNSSAVSNVSCPYCR